MSTAVEAHGISRVEMLSMTIRHGRGHNLGTLRRGLARAWRRVMAHREFRMYAEAGVVRALEVTYGGFAGWHPHLHVLLFMPHALDQRERVWLCGVLHELWCRAVERELGPKHVPDWHGTDVRPARRANYITKLGLDGVGAELTDAGLAKRGKRGGHMTPWEIAAKAAEGNEGYQRLWREYAAEMHGAKQLTWSKGLRKRLGVDKLPEEPVEPYEHVASIWREEWDAMRDLRLPDGRLVRLAILDAVEEGGGKSEVRAIVDECLTRVGRARGPRSPDG